MFKKNTAVTGFPIGHFIGVADGLAVTTGTPTCKRILDGTGAALTNAASYNSDAGQWEIDLAAADTNGDMVGYSFTLTDCLPISYRFRTTTKLVSDLNDAAAGLDAAGVRAAVGLASANLDTQLGTIAKTGADGDTLETLSDQLDAVAPAGSDPSANLTEIIMRLRRLERLVAQYGYREPGRK